MAAEIMGEDIIFVHRPGKSLDLGDLMSRAEFEPDPKEREKMMMDLAKWRQRLEKEGTLPLCKGARQPKEDDMVGESVNNADLPRWALSQAQRALEGDPEAYQERAIQNYLQLMTRGAVVQPEHESSMSLKEKVEEMTQ